MELSGHVVGLLKEYMRDLVEQAKQETAAHASFGFPLRPIGRIRRCQICWPFWTIASNPKGASRIAGRVSPPDVGLCNDARAQVTERVWLEMNSSDQPSSKARVRELTYRALLAVIETSA